ncbi:radical SAM protein [Treponema pedis]|uniref:Radical SAM protein n=1 Tax=Treponema pedis TaxID=409322 RepID=A0A7S6WQ68_9SPIR|nr:radical SAM protein [Treponema pedis]QOW61319.1 radical SAM protein [Treponema pedis]QSI04554.1 radical SAM protein [Treponema pedis]
MVVKWGITDCCNLNCKHCYYTTLKKQTYGLDIRDMKCLVDKLFSAGVDCIQLLGGEPFNYDAITELIDYIKYKGINLWVNTNFQNLSEKTLYQIKNCAFDRFIISLDGADEESNDTNRGDGTFLKIIDNLNKLKNICTVNNNIYINSILNKLGVTRMHFFYSFIKKYDYIKNISISLPDITGNALSQSTDFFSNVNDYLDNVFAFLEKIIIDNIYQKFTFGVSPFIESYIYDKHKIENVFNKNYCMGGCSVYYLDPDAFLYPCNLEYGINYFKKINNCDNNLLKHSFDEIIKCIPFNNFYADVRLIEKNCIDKKTICNKCSFRMNNICQIKCPLDKKEPIYRKMCEYFLSKNKILDSKFEIITKKLTKKIVKNGKINIFKLVPGSRWVTYENSIEFYSRKFNKNYLISYDNVDQIIKILENENELNSGNVETKLLQMLKSIGIIEYAS